jgi:uncharacterized protein (DUF1800 family)
VRSRRSATEVPTGPAAWEPWTPTADDPWDRARVAHLHRRAGFTPGARVLERDLKAGTEAAIALLLEGEGASVDGTPADVFEPAMNALQARAAASGNVRQLQGAWLYRMVLTPHPLRERMTLFWHDHFATSQAKVNNLALMDRQNKLLRSHALGSFPELLSGIGRDPAMLLWLDSATNRKGHPNENYAREVMELFTLGRGHYTEKDIQEAARAYTGRFVQGDRFREVRIQHDPGEKTVLGRSGALTGDDVDRILLEHDASGRFLAAKLHRHFLSETAEPDEATLEALAGLVRSSGHAIRPVVEAILRSRRFHHPAVRWQRVKSPVEYAVGTLRALEVTAPTASPEAVAEACEAMGQSLFAPPSVDGWPGGAAWINTASTLARTNFALGLLSTSDDKLGKRLDPAALARRRGAGSPEKAARFFAELLLPGVLGADAAKPIQAAATREGADAAARTREALSLVLAAPEYQLA